MTWKTLDDFDLNGKVVLVRVDVNVPMEGGRVTDATRIEKIVPTVEAILAKGGKPVLLAHFGRPKGAVVPEMSLRHIVPALEAALGKPERPVVAVVGGAKVSTKLDLLGNLVTKVNHLVIGGGMANTFLVAQGIEVGKSLAERDMAPTALEILDKAKAANCTIHLPVDIVVAREFKAGAASEVLDVRACPPDAMILDAGPATVAKLPRGRWLI
jgi:3-phosphoglycerate kinase